MTNVLPTAEDVQEASERLAEWVIETPVLESAALNERLGTRLLVKAECLQHGGSFKIRGALNRMLQLSHAERSAGVVAFSSGNHAQSVALAARWLGVRATIVMPADAPRVKREATHAWGAEIVLYDREREDREQIAARIAERRGASIVPPFDHQDIIAGQGTVGLELARAASRRKVNLVALYVPCSGGGLVAGVSLAIQQRFEGCAVHAVEPHGWNDTALSLEHGARRLAVGTAATLCDALRAPTPGAITFAVNRERLAGALAVTDDEVLHAMAVAAKHFRLVLEPSGAAGLAAALKQPQRGRAGVGVVLSGGNVDPEIFGRALAVYADA